MGDLFTPLHLIIVLAIILIILGPRRLPEIGSGLGKAIRGFRDATGPTADGDRATVVEATAEPVQRPSSTDGRNVG